MPNIDLNYGWFGASHGPVTVILHGGGPGCHSVSDFEAVMARVPERRWLWVDLPGFGASKPLATASYTTSLCTYAVKELLAQLGLTNVNILAQSLGGCVATQLALENPHLLRRNVIIGSQPARPPDARADLHVKAGLGSTARTEYYGGEGPSVTKMRELMAKLEWYNPALIPKKMVQDRYEASIGLSPSSAITPQVEIVDLSSSLHAVDTPTLVIWGKHDPFAPPSYAEKLVDALPRGEIAVVERTAHHPQSERPDVVTPIVNKFFSDRSLNHV